MTEPFNTSQAAPPPIPLTELMEVPGIELHGALDSDASFRWIERNSREVQSGDLFIAVKGERFDGHDFVADAMTRGATAAMVSSVWLQEQVGDQNWPLLVCEDPVSALQEVARRRRGRGSYDVIGITGSLGKTSTKEAIAAGLASSFVTFRSPGNMNSEIGLPLSLLEVQPGTELAVMEMGGAYAFGELALLATIAQPRIGVVTNVHPIHLERMGSIEAIAETKAELVQSLPSNGYAILNGDDDRVLAMARQTHASVIQIGRGPRNDFRAANVQTSGQDGVAFRLHGADRSVNVRVPIIGEHAVELTLAAVAAGSVFGISVETVLESLNHHHRQVRLMRMAGPNGSIVLDDTYNASEPSVRIALQVLMETPARRRIAVLGDMRELGEESAGQHYRVGQRVAEVTDALFTFGELAQAIGESAGSEAARRGKPLQIEAFAETDKARLADRLTEILQPGDVVLLKGSRGLEMESIVAEIVKTSDGVSPC